MSTHKYIDRICLAGALLSLVLALLFVNGAALGIQLASRTAGYEARLFDTGRVHTIDIVMDGWDDFIDSCEDEEYAACAAVIDGEAYKNIGLRAKGNTSLSTVSAMGSSRYSFKLEFDHYDSGKTYYGLDKLCLNNIIQDNTCMKDYLTYRMMGEFGAVSPLCSYVFLTVNGEDWGLYLAVEGLEESFLQRNYGSGYGDLYKPDSMSFGGGRGNGWDFDMENFDFSQLEKFTPPDMADMPGLPGGFERPGEMAAAGGAMPELPENALRQGGMPGMGSADVKLQYVDDDPASYSNIFSSAKTDVTEADQARLIQALKTLGEGTDIESTVDVDQVLRYFVVHNFVVNGDSYTGSMVHNYYLYEEEGRLTMLPWDYNLAFGTFQTLDASSAVNDPIDTPLSVSGNGDRPMADWIFTDAAYTELYHQYFAEFLETVDPAAIIEEAYGLIAPYVERDPTKFCTFDAFETGVEALSTFCRLRRESVSGQLAGTVPSTDAGQAADRSALVDTSGLTISDMGSMGMGGAGGRGGFGDRGGFGNSENFRNRENFGDRENFRGGFGEQSDPGEPGGPGGQGGSGEQTAPGEQGGFASPGGPGAAFTPETGNRPEGEPSGRMDAMKLETPPGGNGPRDGGADVRQTLLLLGVSVLALPVGILAAWRYRRRKTVKSA